MPSLWLQPNVGAMTPIAFGVGFIISLVVAVCGGDTNTQVALGLIGYALTLLIF